jgi:hypothetical protein
MMGWLRRRWLRLAVIGVPVVLLAMLAVDVAVRYVPAVQALQDGRTAAMQAEALLRNDPAHLDRARVAQAASLLQRASADFGARSAVLDNGWVMSATGHLPWVGDQVQVARALRQTGIAGVRLGLDVVPLLNDMLPDPSDHSAALTRVVTAAVQNRSALDRASADVAALSAAAGRVPSGRVSGPLGSAQATAARDVPRLVDAVTPLRDVLDAITVAAGPGRHSYLVLLGNSAEERPGGGFIGSIGDITLTDGAITSTRFRMSDLANNLVTSIPAPTPLDNHMFHGHPWELSDANWSADFPTSAAEVQHFYELATGEHVDGVISVDPMALGEVLGVLGSVQVPPYTQVITAGNALREINSIINRARPGDPGNAYLAPLGQAVLTRVLHAPIQSYPRLASALALGIQGRHIVMSFSDPKVQSVVAAYHASGALTSVGPNDGLLVADANLSGSKADLLVTRRFDLAVGITSDGTAHDRLTLTYHDARPTNPGDAALVTGSGGAYRDYVRVYLPEDATVDGLLLTANGQTAPVSAEDITTENGRLVVAYYLVVPSGGDLGLEVDYHGPFAHRSGGKVGYQLTWTKQVQALSWPAHVLVVWPDGHRSESSMTLDRDHTWSALS